MAVRFRLNFEALLDTDVVALAGGSLTFYETLTTDLKPIYATKALGAPILLTGAKAGRVTVRPGFHRPRPRRQTHRPALARSNPARCGETDRWRLLE